MIYLKLDYYYLRKLKKIIFRHPYFLLSHLVDFVIK
jgi:hypothetical protein